MEGEWKLIGVRFVSRGRWRGREEKGRVGDEDVWGGVAG